MYKSCKFLHLINGDKCSLEDWVIVSHNGKYVLGKVIEILQVAGVHSAFKQHPDFLTLLLYSTQSLAPKYNMPRLVSSGYYLPVEFEVFVAKCCCHNTYLIFIVECTLYC